MTEIERHDPDETHELLRKAVERREVSYLWQPGDTPAFKPALLPTWYGDGRALFALATINQRPRYYVIRGDSGWECGLDSDDGDGPEFACLTDDIYDDLIEHFGSGRCSYSGSSLFVPKRERQWCKCEDCQEMRMARWPTIDDSGGCSWSRMDWPKGFTVEKNPRSWRGNFIALSATP